SCESRVREKKARKHRHALNREKSFHTHTYFTTRKTQSVPSTPFLNANMLPVGSIAGSTTSKLLPSAPETICSLLPLLKFMRHHESAVCIAPMYQSRRKFLEDISFGTAQ